MSFSDSDWTREIEAARARRRPPLAVRTAVAMALAGGIALGAAGATLLFYASGRLDSVPRLLDALPHSTAIAAPPQQPQASLPAEPAVVTAAPAPPPRPEGQASTEASIPAPQPAIAAASNVKPSADELRRKERAWARWYQRPPSCEGNPSTDQLIECANHFIRSKREFDERWRTGML